MSFWETCTTPSQGSLYIPHEENKKKDKNTIIIICFMFIFLAIIQNNNLFHENKTTSVLLSLKDNFRNIHEDISINRKKLGKDSRR